VALAEAQPARAARLLAAADALAKAIGFCIEPQDQLIHRRHATAARAALGDTALALAWAAGQSLPLDQAIEEALQLSQFS
jgi:hypothetical protein